MVCSIGTEVAAFAEPAPNHFVGGDYDGMGFRDVVRPDGALSAILLPSDATSPADASEAAVISGFLAAYYAEDWRALLKFVAPGAKSWIVERRPFPQVGGPYTGEDEQLASFATFPFAERCVSKPPYKLKGGMIRLEWMCNGELWYVSWLKISAGRVTAMETRRAGMPQAFMDIGTK
jgi:hypothetical protein